MTLRSRSSSTSCFITRKSEVIDTITSKAVLILGRFTEERKAVLDALREELRKRDYLPILFDFDVPATRDITETISLLARMARFVVADITDAKSIPQELAVIVISCSHRPPDGSVWALVGRHGAMNPAETVRCNMTR